MKVHEKIRSMRQSKGWSQPDMAEKLDMSVNGYANIERGETDVQVLEKIAETFGMDLLELLNFGEKNVFYWNGDNNHLIKSLQSTHFSEEKNECEHELDKARLLLQQQEKEIAYLKEINSLMKKESAMSKSTNNP
ncbi:hypothetical protein PN36_21635 [Candidatus Thiomargarita nelsonii]|uniref:HTH cro/C1-type domain-containing protein n=1 Tax=Candidatus Thiomargarita nelsonii TaxID=1003181 RepID=A0A4E0R1N0_9GAMM|nr:hypothetical protein PN36_21635 [Candidatus Thiomargarita nelsonii]